MKYAAFVHVCCMFLCFEFAANTPNINTITRHRSLSASDRLTRAVRTLKLKLQQRPNTHLCESHDCESIVSPVM